jgi:lipoprotein-anchoring transpeptidase ErfK/SrfK
MNTTSLQRKTVRPGSLNGYSYYYSRRQTGPATKTAPSFKFKLPAKLVVTAAVLLAIVGLPLLRGNSDAPTNSTTQKPSTQSQLTATQSSNNAALPAATTVNNCAGNSLDKLIKVSVSQRHLWACEGDKVVQDTPVITGILAHPETLTPLGTYHIYGKQQNTTLKGSDSTGSWSDPVYYWMPFLDNQHGTYGFHDATWRQDSEFGSVDPNSDQASHGCVELPLGASQKLYEWAPVRTTVTVES